MELLELELEFLNQADVKREFDHTGLKDANAGMKLARKNQFDESLKYAKMVGKAYTWFSKQSTQEKFSEAGISWSVEDFWVKGLDISKSHFYRILKVNKILVEKAELVTAYKRECTMAERQGDAIERSVAELIRRANAPADEKGGDADSQRSDTIVTFAIKKSVFEDGKGVSLRILEDGEVVIAGDESKISSDLIDAIKELIK